MALWRWMLGAATFEDVNALLQSEAPELNGRVESAAGKADYLQFVQRFREVLIQSISLTDYVYNGRPLPAELLEKARSVSIKVDPDWLLDILMSIRKSVEAVYNQHRRSQRSVQHRLLFWILVGRIYPKAIEALNDLVLYARGVSGEPGELLTGEEMLSRLDG